MPKLNEYTKSDFVKAGTDVKTGDRIAFLDGGEPDTSQYGKRLTFNVKLPSGEEKKFSPNKTSLRELGTAWGDDTDTWAGKVAEVHITKQAVQGQLRDIIYLTPIGGVKEEDIPVIEEENGEIENNVSESDTEEELESEE